MPAIRHTSKLGSRHSLPVDIVYEDTSNRFQSILDRTTKNVKNLNMARKKNILDRRERIIQAADSLFNHYGVEKTTMEDISRESGIPRATVYLEFPGGKEDILMASIEHRFHQLLSEMRELTRQSRVGRLDTLKQVILYNIMSNYDRATDFQYSPANLAYYSNRVRTEMNSFFKERQNFFADLLQQAALNDEVSREYDYNRLAELITHGLMAFMPPVCTRFTREELEMDANAFFGLLLSGIAKEQRVLQA
jgi:AcrR family transcriptional regulator